MRMLRAGKKGLTAPVYRTWTHLWHLWQSYEVDHQGPDVQTAPRISLDKDMQRAFFLSYLLKGLLTRHCHLEGHLFKLAIINNLICGRCHDETEITSHILRECDALAELEFRCLGEHFMNPSTYIQSFIPWHRWYIHNQYYFISVSTHNINVSNIYVYYSTSSTSFEYIYSFQELIIFT
jgi:hypothetical protein